MVQSGDELARLIMDGLKRTHLTLKHGDIIAVAQKIVSKSENRMVRLADVKVSDRAKTLAKETEKDPRVVQLILDESRRIVRQRPGAIIVEHRLGLVLANAGIDRSNLESADDHALLLPVDPDASAAHLRKQLSEQCNINLGILITDSLGRPWRLGSQGIAIGASGVPALSDLRGSTDLFGRVMETSEISPADSLAAAATLAMGEGPEGTPVTLIRGWPWTANDQSAADIVRPSQEDLFR